MSDFGHISKEEHQEWLRSPATSAAIADLREQERLANDSTLASAVVASVDEIRFNAGFARGITHIIHYLTRERK